MATPEMATKPDLQIALVLIWRDGHVLVTRRRATADHLPGLWEFPGGKREGEETLQACALREAREELGVEVRVEGARRTLRFEYAERIVTLYPFDCALVCGEPQPLQASEMRWLLPCEIRHQEFPPANEPLLRDLRGD